MCECKSCVESSKPYFVPSMKIEKKFVDPNQIYFYFLNSLRAKKNDSLLGDKILKKWRHSGFEYYNMYSDPECRLFF